MKRREPNFDNVMKVLRREEPPRPVLFELFMDHAIYEKINGRKPDGEDDLSWARFIVEAFARLGYDYATLHGSAFGFPIAHRDSKSSISLNDGAVISDEASFDAYAWPDPDKADYSRLGKVGPYMPDGMKLMVMGPGGVLENVTSLIGYDNMCFMLYEDPELLQRVFDAVGERLVRYYENVLQYDTVGLISSNDDWGFNTQTFLSPADMRKYVFPWHKKIVDTVHAAGRPIFLHSCGFMGEVIDDIVSMGYDAKHSYEDTIMPIEKAYEAWHDRIALLGGIDVNFICTRPPEEIRARTRAMLERTRGRGGWAVGTGNSVPYYVPLEGYIAMVEEAIGYNPLA